MMATESTTGLYPFDPTGESSDNFIYQEQQVLTTPGRDDYYFIIPKAAPFFVESLELRMDGSSTLLVEGVDYVVGHWFIEAMHGIGKPIGGSIRFFDHDLTGVVLITYQTLGGQWGFDDSAILEELSNRLLNPLVRSWAEIDVLPAAFPPIPHDQRVDTLIGWEEVVNSIATIHDALINQSDNTNLDHINSRDNPHYVTKYQVGLGNVKNYGPADETASREGVLDNLYMTPLGVSRALDQFYTDNIDGLLSGGDNPTGVTKEQIGLGNVENYGVADQPTAVAGASNSTLLTPLRGSQLITEKVGRSLSDHLSSTNPHNIALTDLGGLTETDIDTKLLDYLPKDGVAYDSVRFSGLTREELQTEILKGTASDSVLFNGKTENQLALTYRDKFALFRSYDINGENAGKWIRMITRPYRFAADDSILPSGHVSFLMNGRHYDQRDALFYLHFGEPGESVTATILNNAKTDLEIKTTLDENEGQSLWVKSTGTLENINFVALGSIGDVTTQMEDIDDPLFVDTLVDPSTDVVITGMISSLESELTAAFNDAISELTK